VLGRGAMPIGVGASATPGHGRLPAGVENGQRSTGVSFQASPGLRRRCGSWVMGKRKLSSHSVQALGDGGKEKGWVR
jgi:hypothetical protein